VSGIILGLDTDTPATAANLIDFIDQSHIPVLTINLLQALPKTPLWDRLAASGRLSSDPERESNVVFLRPYDEVLASWHQAIRHAYTPEVLFERFAWNLRRTYPNRIALPASRARINTKNLRRAAIILGKAMLRLGLLSDYRRIFWRFAGEALRAGRIGELIAVALVAQHMIRFARECTEGRQNASFYADRPKAATEEPAAAA
jgi:radical SAM superfamily enzyme YgiQ (UPF0313 family)